MPALKLSDAFLGTTRTTRRIVILFAMVLFTVGARGAEKTAAKGKYLVYIGTYTQGESKGIYAYRFDAETGESTSLGLAAATTNPSFLVIHPNRRFLYAVNEISSYEGRASEGVSAFVIDHQNVKLTCVNELAFIGADLC